MLCNISPINYSIVKKITLWTLLRNAQSQDHAAILRLPERRVTGTAGLKPRDVCGGEDVEPLMSGPDLKTVQMTNYSRLRAAGAT